MLGSDVVDVLSSSGDKVVGLGHEALDIRDSEACRTAIAGFDVIVNTAAWTDVDGAETHEHEAFAVNAVGPANLARACDKASAVLVHVSTDYVFAGDAVAPYTVDTPVAPINAYGRTKAAGEWAVLAACRRSYVVRTAWLYGANGASFPATMLRLAAEREFLDVVADQRGQPTWTRDLAEYVRTLVTGDAPFGVHHGTAAGDTTWFGFARETLRRAGLDPERVRSTTSLAFPRPARRPAYSVLAGEHLPGWSDGLARAMPGLLAARRP
jgi:dTDP-4-dehydrorhamnose reductase